MPKKKTIVNRKFLNALADRIYNSKERTFLRLCTGTLQDGPDPTDVKRHMHCGLGELYYAMTGHQPERDGVNEDDVVNLAVELSTLKTKDKDAVRSNIEKMVMKLDLPKTAREILAEHAYDIEDDDLSDEAEDKFRVILDGIPGTNDDGKGEECSVTDFRQRSKRVASKLRAAAKVLPE